MTKTNQPITPLIDPVCDVYVETGTHNCTSLNSVLSLPHFKMFYSIELSDEWYNLAINAKRNDPRIKIIKGDSAIKLGDVLSEIDDKHPTAKCCIFLDSHYSGPGTAMGKEASPIKSELNSLIWYRHLVRQVFIDDTQAALDLYTGDRVFEQNEIYYRGWESIEEIKRKLYQINDQFTLTLDKDRRVWGLLYTKL